MRGGCKPLPRVCILKKISSLLRLTLTLTLIAIEPPTPHPKFDSFHTRSKTFNVLLVVKEEKDTWPCL